MKIAIDVSALIYETGVSVYTRNLISSLLATDRENKYLLFGGSLRRLGELQEKVGEFKTEKKLFPIPPLLADLLWNRFHYPEIERLVGDLDIFHSSDWTQPPTKAFKVTTIHDLFPLKYPKYAHPRIVHVHRRRMKWIIKEVDRIIVPSRATKEDLLRMKIDEERIEVIPEAPDPIYQPQKKEVVEALKKKYQIQGDYLLAVGVNPRKNTKRIIEAYGKVRTSDLKLVILGRQEEKHRLKRGMIFTGHIPRQEMPIFYSGARVLVYPSLYEGFGLPILEAFSTQTPVITSNISSMPEVAGDAAILVDPYQTDSIIEGIKIGLSQPKTWIRKGQKRIKDFSWQKTAQETLKVYEEAK